MRVGLVIYGSIETLTGGYLYDRRLLDHLASQGDRAEVISLPRRNHYSRALCDNASPSLVRRLTRARFDVQTELAARARATRPLCILSVANVLPGKGPLRPDRRPLPPARRELAFTDRRQLDDGPADGSLSIASLHPACKVAASSTA